MAVARWKVNQKRIHINHCWDWPSDIEFSKCSFVETDHVAKLHCININVNIKLTNVPKYRLLTVSHEVKTKCLR